MPQRVLEGLRTAFATGRFDGRLQGVDRLRLALDQPLDGIVGLTAPLQPGDVGRRG